jgi:hypothetical protein
MHQSGQVILSEDCSALIDELSAQHRGAPTPVRPVFAELQAAYEKALAAR